jgi:parallel beta-helix repeat protein
VGIHLYRKSNTQLIEDNEFCRNASHGIYVQDGGARERTIARNTVLGNGSDGIRLITAPSVVVIGNQVPTTRSGWPPDPGREPR